MTSVYGNKSPIINYDKDSLLCVEMLVWYKKQFSHRLRAINAKFHIEEEQATIIKKPKMWQSQPSKPGPCAKTFTITEGV